MSSNKNPKDRSEFGEIQNSVIEVMVFLSCLVNTLGSCFSSLGKGTETLSVTLEDHI